MYCQNFRTEHQVRHLEWVALFLTKTLPQFSKPFFLDWSSLVLYNLWFLIDQGIDNSRENTQVRPSYTERRVRNSKMFYLSSAGPPIGINRDRSGLKSHINSFDQILFIFIINCFAKSNFFG